MKLHIRDHRMEMGKQKFSFCFLSKYLKNTSFLKLTRLLFLNKMIYRPSRGAWSFLCLVWLDNLKGRLYTETKQYKRGAGIWQRKQ
ncbi:hypothetical protein CWJ11_06455 [Listeria monocytogenes]|nr:hypothetical protein [Listeria monocytogenes]